MRKEEGKWQKRNRENLRLRRTKKEASSYRVSHRPFSSFVSFRLYFVVRVRFFETYDIDLFDKSDFLSPLTESANFLPDFFDKSLYNIFCKEVTV